MRSTRGYLDRTQRGTRIDRPCPEGDIAAAAVYRRQAMKRLLLIAAAARAALMSKKMLESHIQTCVAAAFDSEDERATNIAALVRVFEKTAAADEGRGE